MSASDEECIAAFLNGDERAFLALVDRYQRPLYGWLRRMTRDAQSAEDLFQEVFLKVFRSLPQLREPERFRIWLFRIAVHQARRFLGRRRPTFSIEADEQAASRPEAPDDDLLEALREAVDLLPERQREVVLLRTYRGLSYEEIARCLAVTEENARANYYQALKKLRASFGRGEER